MLEYNVEFFDFSLNNKHHAVVSDLDVDNDYLSLTENSIEILKTSRVEANQIIYIKDLDGYVGIITKVTNKEFTTEISFKSFIGLFDHDVVIDVKWQGKKTTKKALEEVIKQKIVEYWCGNNAFAQNISALSTPTTTSSTNWKMGFKKEGDFSHYCSCGLYNDLIYKAMYKYGIVVNVSLDFVNKEIDISIGKRSESYLYIEADLDNATIETFSIKEASNSVNELEIWNSSNYPNKIYYYLHEQGDPKYSTSKTNRILPAVIQVSVIEVTPEDNQSMADAFAEAALEEAENVFAAIEFTNLIELTFDIDDKVVNPTKLKLGRKVKVVHDGVAYATILTGKKVSGDYITLVFGRIRHDLTKKLKGIGR